MVWKIFLPRRLPISFSASANRIGPGNPISTFSRLITMVFFSTR